MLFIALASSSAHAVEHVEGFEDGVIDDRWWEVDTKGGCEIEAVSEPTRSGSFALRLRSTLNSRCELVHWPHDRLFQWFRREPYDEHRWYGFSIFLPEGREIGPADQNEIVAQWHASDDPWFFEPGGRGPPLALRVQGTRWRITHGWDAQLRSEPGVKSGHDLWTGRVQYGTWHDWVFHVVWSISDEGLIEVWKDGEQVARYRGPTAYNDLRGVYLKVGSYHPRGADQVMYLDEFRTGGDQSLMSPLMRKSTETARAGSAGGEPAQARP